MLTDSSARASPIWEKRATGSFNAIIPNKVSIKVMYHLYHHQLQIALFNGLFPLLFRVRSLTLLFTHTRRCFGCSLLHCLFFFIVAFFVSPPHSSICHGYHTEKLNKEKIFFLLRYIRRERNTELCLFDCCDAFCLSFLCCSPTTWGTECYAMKKHPSIDERNRINENVRLSFMTNGERMNEI